jgi:SAM-dependent methyltransferase
VRQVRDDHYARAGPRWATGATLVYAPIAAELVAGLGTRVAPAGHGLRGHIVLDAGAGTGIASAALAGCGARPVAVDFSPAMLSWDAAARPPAAAADVCALPLADDGVDDAVAAFVLNHLTQPAVGLAELARVTRPGGVVAACVYSTASRSAVRDHVDDVARGCGWSAPPWYVELKASVIPLLGTAGNMAGAARAAGLVDVVVDERPVDVGVTQPEQLVDYRFGQAHFATWLDAIGDDRAEQVRRRAADAIRPIMEPYRPVVVFLLARVQP